MRPGMSGDEERVRLTNLLADCYDDPDLFNSVILGRPHYWKRQREICRSICDYRITVVYSGNAVGKDYLAGGIPPWWLYTRHRSLCIVTGPSQTVLGSVTWKELRRACEGNPHDPLGSIPLGATVSAGIKGSPLRLTVAGDWGALGYSTTSVERASGQHDRKLLVIVQEASGVEDEIWDAIDSLKYVKMVAFLNPVRSRGRAIELIRQAEKDRLNSVAPRYAVNAIRIPSWESPDAALEESPRGLADRTWLADVERRYGKNSLYYRAHVAAEIPETDADILLDPAWLDGCVSAPAPVRDPRDVALFRSRRITVDLGEGGGRDESAIFVTDALGIIECVAGNTIGLEEAAESVSRLRSRYQVPDERISYDRVGIGRDFRNHLQRRGIVGAVPYAGSGSARDQRQFINLRSEAAWRFRERINPDWSPDPFRRIIPSPFHVPSLAWWGLLREDLAALTYDLVGSQVRLIPKKDLCQVLGRSPDRGDALLQRFAFE